MQEPLEFPLELVDRTRFTTVPPPVPRPARPEPALDPTAMLALALDLVRRAAPDRPGNGSVRAAFESLGPLDGWSLLQAMTLGFTSAVPESGPHEAAVRDATGWRLIGASRYRHPDGSHGVWWSHGARLLAGLAPGLVTADDVAASLDVVETELAALPDDCELGGATWEGWSATWRELAWVGVELDPHDVRRWFGLERWVHELLDRPGPGRNLWAAAVVARRVGVCTLEDLWWVVARTPGLVGDLTRQREGATPGPTSDALAEMQASAGPIVNWLVDTEIERGKPETPATAHALCVSSLTGAARIARLLGRMAANREQFVAVPSKPTRNHVLTRLARVSHPLPGETAAELTGSLRREHVTEEGLLQLVMVTPRWADLAEESLGWPGLADAACWLHAHCEPDASFSVGAPDRWKPLLEERTTVPLADIRQHGVIDRDLFEKALAGLGPERWDALSRHAKLASQNKSHLRALAAADALLGRLQPGPGLDVAIDIEALVPLPGEGVGRQAELSRRIERIRAVDPDRTRRPKRGTRDLFTNAMRNLARTAGFADPRHLTWGVEAGAQLEPGRTPESPKPRRNAEQQAAHDLEQAMIAGHRFDLGLLEVLRAHCYLWPVVRALVMTDAAGRLGCLADEGALVDEDGSAQPVADWVQVVHPVALDGDVAARWLEHVGAQPFKQLAREVFRPAAGELRSPTTAVWKGMPVKPFRAIAVAQSRGWVLVDPGVELVKRFERGPVDAWIRFEGGRVLPNERTPRFLDVIGFSRAGEATIAEVDPIVYSEVVRDASLLAALGHFRAGEAASPH